ncbi:MAG: 30S ribosomal protein S6 [Candidatus Magasanikbacteria bacterium]
MQNFKEKRLQWYDLTVLSEEEGLPSVKENIEDKNPEELEVEEPEKIDLAYEIQEKDTAYMGVFNFKMESSKADELKSELSNDRSVLRFMLLRDRLREKKEKKQRKDEDFKGKEDSGDSDSNSQREDDQESSLTNEDIEEKIEELQ